MLKSGLPLRQSDISACKEKQDVAARFGGIAMTGIDAPTSSCSVKEPEEAVTETLVLENILTMTSIRKISQQS
jgi:hypothetical protein